MMRSIRAVLYLVWMFIAFMAFKAFPSLTEYPSQIAFWFGMGFLFLLIPKIRKKESYVERGQSEVKYDVQLISAGNVIKQFENLEEHNVSFGSDTVRIWTDNGLVTWNGEFLIERISVWVEYEEPKIVYY